MLCRTQHFRRAARKACRDINEAESPWSSWPCDSFGQNQEGGDRERALWFDEPVRQRSQEQHPDLVVRTHLMRCSRAVTLLEVGPRSEMARSPRRMWRTPSSSHRGPWDFIRHQNSQGDVENGFCDGVAGLKDKEDKRSCSRSCPSWPRTPPNRMKVEEAGRQVASVVLRNA